MCGGVLLLRIRHRLKTLNTFQRSQWEKLDYLSSFQVFPGETDCFSVFQLFPRSDQRTLHGMRQLLAAVLLVTPRVFPLKRTESVSFCSIARR